VVSTRAGIVLNAISRLSNLQLWQLLVTLSLLLCPAAVQCRVEGNPQNRMQFRVTVAAPDAMLASSLKDIIAGQIFSLP
jgi:hypothetical protein